MGAGFCNLNRLGWNTQTPLPPPLLLEQRTLHSRKVGREGEGVSSSRPELVALAKCQEDHEDNISPLYLTDSEAILQAIHRWIQSLDWLRSETPPLQIARRGRPKKNYTQTTKESSSGSSDFISESLDSQGRPTQ
jgi:hypothetical protein